MGGRIRLAIKHRFEIENNWVQIVLPFSSAEQGGNAIFRVAVRNKRNIYKPLTTVCIIESILYMMAF